jgi:hypothetical protein
MKLPKILVLVSKYPIYKDMEEFLRKIRSICLEFTNVPLESMIMNLVFEFPHPGEKWIVKSEFWRNKRKSDFEYETVYSLPFWDAKYFSEIAKLYDRMLIVWHLIEKVLFGKPVILISKHNHKLIAWTEILKNLIFPFEFPGLVIPYMARVDLMVLSSESNLSYIVGISPETYKHWKYFLSPIVTCFDIDSKNFYYNKREFFQATDVEIINSPIINNRK